MASDSKNSVEQGQDHARTDPTPAPAGDPGGSDPGGLATNLQPGGTIPGKSPGASVGSLGTGGGSTAGQSKGSVKRGI